MAGHEEDPAILRQHDRPTKLRLITYNVHSCIGADGRLSVERVADVIAALHPDIVALQEVDVGQKRSAGSNQGEEIARRTGMSFLFSSAREHDGGHYGNAVLSTFPLTGVREGHLPARRGGRPLERRVAQLVKVVVGAHELHLVNTHLSLDRHERLGQARALLSSEWIQHPSCVEPLLVCGDFNSLPWSNVYRSMRRHLADARGGLFSRPSATFPSWLPLVRLDYVFVSGQVAVRSTKVPWTRRTRAASDHLPFVVDFALTDLRGSGETRD